MSNVSSSSYDLAAYALLSSVILEEQLQLVGPGSEVGWGSKKLRQEIFGQDLKLSDNIALKRSYLTVGKRKSQLAKKDWLTGFWFKHHSKCLCMLDDLIKALLSHY